MLHLYRLGWYSWMVGFYYSAYMCKLYMRVEKHAIPSVNKALVKTPTFNVIVILSRKYMFKVLRHMPSSWSLLKKPKEKSHFHFHSKTTQSNNILLHWFCWNVLSSNVLLADACWEHYQIYRKIVLFNYHNHPFILSRNPSGLKQGVTIVCH